MAVILEDGTLPPEGHATPRSRARRARMPASASALVLGAFFVAFLLLLFLVRPAQAFSHHAPAALGLRCGLLGNPGKEWQPAHTPIHRTDSIRRLRSNWRQDLSPDSQELYDERTRLHRRGNVSSHSQDDARRRRIPSYHDAFSRISAYDAEPQLRRRGGTPQAAASTRETTPAKNGQYHDAFSCAPSSIADFPYLAPRSKTSSSAPSIPYHQAFGIKVDSDVTLRNAQKEGRVNHEGGKEEEEEEEIYELGRGGGVNGSVATFRRWVLQYQGFPSRKRFQPKKHRDEGRRRHVPSPSASITKSSQATEPDVDPGHSRIYVTKAKPGTGGKDVLFYYDGRGNRVEIQDAEVTDPATDEPSVVSRVTDPSTDEPSVVSRVTDPSTGEPSVVSSCWDASIDADKRRHVNFFDVFDDEGAEHAKQDKSWHFFGHTPCYGSPSSPEWTFTKP